jgi:UDP-2,3-diacylglucosamine pyrophosphatase LpxH
MAEDGLARIVVFSDFHFGEEKSVLSGEDMVSRLFAELRELGEIDKLVLLGDVWDLWRTDLTQAVGAGDIFFRALADWKGPREIALVPGNHDYHLITFSEERRERANLRWDESREGYIILGAGPEAEAGGLSEKGLALKVYYPFLPLVVRGKTVLLMHGHHLDFFSRSFWWAKTAWLARWVLGTSSAIALSDIDRLNLPFFEVLTVTAHVPELVAKVYRFYGVLRFLARLLRFGTKSGASPRRYTSVEENTGESSDLLGKLLPGYIPDVFVFGHTHRAGFSRINVGRRPVLMANSGCWVEGSGDETVGTYLVIDDAVHLRSLEDFEIPMEI